VVLAEHFLGIADQPDFAVRLRSSFFIWAKGFLLTVIAVMLGGGASGQPNRIPRIASPPSRLHILSIGVSVFDSGELNLTYASSDALAIADTLGKLARPKYAQVQITTLTDKHASGAAILNAIRELHKAAYEDVVFIFMTSHGFLDEDGAYYFATPGTSFADPQATSLAGAALAKAMIGIPAKTFLLLGTCHAGGFLRDLTHVSAKRLSQPRLGVVAASVTGTPSYECAAWKAGAFGKAIIEGLGGKADLLGSGQVRFYGLAAYICARIDQLTAQVQKPVVSLRGDFLDDTLLYLPSK
jgi:Caspase domain